MGRSPCCDKEKVKRGPWSPEEDAVLKSYVETYGTGGNWIALPNKAGLKRCGKSCRLRWLNYLRPDIKHGGFTEQEDNIIFSLYETMGSRWSVIASQLPGRTDNDVKNHWNTKLRKKLMAPKTKDLHPHMSSNTCASTQWTSPSSAPSTPSSLARASGVVTASNSVKYVYNDTSKFDSVNHQHENSVISQGIEAGYSYYNMDLSHKLELDSMPSAFAESPSQQSNEDSVNFQPLPCSSFDSSCISWILNSGVGAEDSFSPVDPSAGFRCESQKSYLVQERGSQLMDGFSASAAYNSASFIFPYANLLLSPDVAPIL